jgi:hypothetical protein
LAVCLSFAFSFAITKAIVVTFFSSAE